MKPRAKLLVGVTALCLSCTAYLAVRAETCRRAIHEESNLRGRDPSHVGLFCLWQIEAGAPVKQTPTFWQLLGGARPVEVWLNGDAEPPVTVEQAQRMGNALRFFRSLKKINVQAAGAEGMALFMSLGRQPALTEAYAIRVPITDDVNQALARFPNLRVLDLATTQYTGSGFPWLPELTSVDVQYSPISIEGLRSITESPKLAAIVVYYPPLVRQYAEVSLEIKKKHPHLLGLDFDLSAVPK